MSRIKNYLLDLHAAGLPHPQDVCPLCADPNRTTRPISPDRHDATTSLPVGAPGSMPARGMFTSPDARAIASTILWLRRHHEEYLASRLTDAALKHDPVLESVVMMGWLYE